MKIVDELHRVLSKSKMLITILFHLPTGRALLIKNEEMQP